MDSRIGILMDSFSISGKDLAALLHIDSSLVSKWKSGKRAFRPNSVYTTQIIKHVMMLDSSNQFGKIKQILSSDYSGIYSASDNEIALFLKDWLTSGSNSKDTTVDIMAELKEIKNLVPLSLYALSGSNGRRRAVEFLQKTALESSVISDIWLYTTETKRWLFEDMSYHDEFQKRFIELIERGCRIKVIHAISESYESLALDIFTWMPMHMTGKTQAYFIPRYKYEQLGYTFMLLKDSLAVYNWSPKIVQGDINTYISHEKQMVKDVEVMLDEYFSESFLIFERFYYDMSDDYLNNMVSILEGESQIFHWCTTLPLYSVSESSIRKILKANDIQDDKLETFAERLVLLGQLYRKSKNRFIIDIDLLSESMMKDEVVLNDFSFVCGKDIKVSHDLYVELQREVFSDSNANTENSSVCLNTSKALRSLAGTRIVAKEGGRIIFSSTDGDRAKTLITKELSVVTALYSYFEELWNSTPYVSRNKEYVGGQILKQIDIIEKRRQEMK